MKSIEEIMDHPCKNLEFDLCYNDGTPKRHIEEGVLFSVDEDDRMDIHVGTSRPFVLFGTVRCLIEYINAFGLQDPFMEYLNAFYPGLIEEEGGDDNDMS